MWWQPILALVLGLLLVYVGLLGLFFVNARRHPGAVGAKRAMRLLPDIVRLVRRLASDRSVPRGVRARLILLLLYLASPIDLIPDFIPVVGYADDAVLVALVLRSVLHRTGSELVTHHWPGDSEGLSVVLRLAGVPDSASDKTRDGD